MKTTNPTLRSCRARSAGRVSAALLAAAALSGCLYKGAKITEGTDLAIGLTVPGSEGMLQLNALNYLSGFRLGVAKDASLTLEYSTLATNSYFGIVHTETAKTIKAKVEPLADPTSSPDLSCAAGASSPSADAETPKETSK